MIELPGASWDIWAHLGPYGTIQDHIASWGFLGLQGALHVSSGPQPTEQLHEGSGKRKKNSVGTGTWSPTKATDELPGDPVAQIQDNTRLGCKATGELPGYPVAQMQDKWRHADLVAYRRTGKMRTSDQRERERATHVGGVSEKGKGNQETIGNIGVRLRHAGRAGHTAVVHAVRSLMLSEQRMATMHLTGSRIPM